MPRWNPRRWDRDSFEEARGEWARETLDEVVRVLGSRRSGSIRRLVTRMDARYRADTVPDPFADPAQPWWRRRDWR